MGSLRACFIVAISALAAACGNDGGAVRIDAGQPDASPDAKIFMDAPPPVFDLACIGNSTPPATAPANIALSGTAQLAEFSGSFNVSPIDMAQVKACTSTACNGSPPSALSDATGAWAIAAVPTNGTALDAYLEMTKTNVRTTFVYPGLRFSADQAGIPILAFGPALLSLLNQGFSCNTTGPVMAVAVTDCSNMPITDTANINIVVKQGGNVVAGAMVTDLSTIPMAPAQVKGLFLVCGVPANSATSIGATYKGMALLAHDVKTVNNTTTTTQVSPGY